MKEAADMKAKKTTGANGCAVAGITAAQARDELRARQLAQRLIDLSHHCEEALYHCPDEPLFSVESLFAAEAERTRGDGTPKHVIRRAVAICAERAKAEAKDRARTLAAWEARADELRRGEYIDRQAESKAFFEAHKNDTDGGRGAVDEYNAILRAERKRNEEAAQADPFYYVTPKTPKPSGDWWYSSIAEQAERAFMCFLEGERIGRRVAIAERADDLKPPSIDALFEEAERQAQRTHGDAAATALYHARQIFLVLSGGAKPDEVKAMQRERAARWIRDEDASGNAPSIAQAALQFGGEIENEREDGGYSSVDALRTALYKFADELGIAKFKKRGK